MPCPINDSDYSEYLKKLFKTISLGNDQNAKIAVCNLKTPINENGCVLTTEDNKKTAFPFYIIEIDEASFEEIELNQSPRHYFTFENLRDLISYIWEWETMNISISAQGRYQLTNKLNQQTYAGGASVNAKTKSLDVHIPYGLELYKNISNLNSVRLHTTPVMGNSNICPVERFFTAPNWEPSPLNLNFYIGYESENGYLLLDYTWFRFSDQCDWDYYPLIFTDSLTNPTFFKVPFRITWDFVTLFASESVGGPIGNCNFVHKNFKKTFPLYSKLRFSVSGNDQYAPAGNIRWFNAGDVTINFI